MTRPNELAEPLEIAEDRGSWPADGSMCAIRFDARRDRGRKLDRPARIILQGNGFEATYLASHADLVAIRDWTAKAVAALEAARPELTDAHGSAA